MKRKKKYKDPFDSCHNIMFNEYPLEYTNNLGIPGEFIKKIDCKVDLKDSSRGQMDSAYVAKADNELLFENVAVNLEHQSYPVDDKKLNQIGKYDIQLVVNENLPTFMVVASHLDKKLSKNLLKRSPSNILKLYFLNLDEKNICQRLNRVEEIINNNKNLTTEDLLNLGIIGLYAPRDKASEIIKRIVNLYVKIVNNLDRQMEYVLYSVLNYLIDAFTVDEKEYKRMINMIDKNTSNESVEEFESIKCSRRDLMNVKEELSDTKEELSDVKEALSNSEDKIASLEEEVERLRNQLGK